MKTLFIAGNWKSNKTRGEAKEWSQALAKKLEGHCLVRGVTVVVCAPFTALSQLKEDVQALGLPIALGAQNVSAFDDGAYTGEISARLVHELADWVIIGHSERRTHQHETDEELKHKVIKAKAVGLQVIYCVPDAQASVPAGVDIVAYEPVWAIGTGKTDSPENANDVCEKIRERTGVATVIYGGSVTDANVASFVSMPNINGVLPGGASLDPEKFYDLLVAAATALA